MTPSHDIIGDIHGQAAKLEALLGRLGYKHSMGAWRHPSRTVMFVGDLIDRGPEQLKTLRMVRDMIEAGSAQMVMGNHEFNGIAYATPDTKSMGHHLRVRNAKNQNQHKAFLGEIGLDTPQHKHWVEWFLTLPLWLETDHLRLVHACWHEPSMTYLKDHLGANNTVTMELLDQASRKGSPAYDAVEALCKGLEIDLPPGVLYADKEGVVRSRARVKWWDTSALTYKQAALMGRDADALPDTAIPESARTTYDNKKPVFFGHYWFTGNPRTLSDKMCCVDYSAARDSEPLVAYQWDGEDVLKSDKLVAVTSQNIYVKKNKF